MWKLGLAALLAVFFAAQPAIAAESFELQQLEQRLAASAQENPGDFGIAALDLTTGETIGVNSHRPFPMASTMKIAVAAAYLAEVDAGRRSLHDAVGSSTAFDLLDRMMVRSDNRATDELLAALGGPQAVDRWLRSHGLSGIRIDRTIAQLLAARRDLWDVRDSSTPVAMLEFTGRRGPGADAAKPRASARHDAPLRYR